MVSEGAKIDPADGRADPRMNLFLFATVEADGRSLAVRIRNLSVRGAMIESPGLPREGSAIVSGCAFERPIRIAAAIGLSTMS